MTLRIRRKGLPGKRVSCIKGGKLRGKGYPVSREGSSGERVVLYHGFRNDRKTIVHTWIEG